MIVEPVTEELAETIAALKVAPKDMVDAINRLTAQAMVPAWQDELNKSVPASRSQAAVLMPGANAYSFTDGFAITAATSKNPLAGGVVPAKYARAFEFGTQYAKHTPFAQRSRSGNWYQVRNKHTNAQMPPRSRTGWVIYPAATRITKRIFQLYTQTVVRAFRDAVDRI